MIRPRRLRDVIADFAAGAVVVCDDFCDQPGEVAVRTLVLPDGDLCVSINARVLADADFPARFEAHSRCVLRTLAARQARVQRVVDGVSVGLGLLAPTAYAAARIRSDATTLWTWSLLEGLVSFVAVEVINAAVFAVIGLLAAGLGRRLIQRWLKRALIGPGD